MSNEIPTLTVTDKQVGESLGWTICNTPHSESFSLFPYWDNCGGYEGYVDGFQPTTDIHDALHALVSAEISSIEICEFIIEKKKASE